MRNILIPACLAIIVLAACFPSVALSSPNLDISQKSALAKAGSFAPSFAPSINVEAIDTGQAASGNSNPVNLTVNVTQLSSGSDQTAEAICGLERFNFEIYTLEVPPGGKAVRIMMVSPAHDNFMYAPCSYLVSIIPITDYLNQGSPDKPSPGKQNTWENGVYTLRLIYMNEGYEIAGKTFSFTIGAGTLLGQTAKFNDIVAINPKLSPRDVDPINQLNPQPEPPIPSNPSFLVEKGNQETYLPRSL